MFVYKKGLDHNLRIHIIEKKTHYNRRRMKQIKHQAEILGIKNTIE